MIEKIGFMKDIKVHYVEIILNQNFSEFDVFVLKMQKCDDKYKSYIARQYYLFLTKSLLHNWFIKAFFKKKMRFDNFRLYYYNL